MKLLFLSHMFPNVKRPVTGTFVLDLARYIQRIQPVTVLAPIIYFPGIYKTKKYYELDMVPHEDEICGIKAIYPKIFMIPKFFKWTQGFFYASRVLAKEKNVINDCDVIVAHWTFPDAFAGIKWSKKLNKKILLIVHGNESICYYEPNSIKKRLIGKTLRNIEMIIAVSNDLKRKMIETFGVEEAKIKVIQNGVDLTKFKPVAQNDAKNRLGLPNDKKIIISVARLSREKSLDTIIEALKTEDELPDYIAYIIGEGPERKKLEGLIDKYNLNKKIVLVGAKKHEEIYLWMCAADIFLLPSMREGTPVVIGESFACGTPVVASDVGGIPDVINDQRLGILIQPGSAISLRDALKTALNKEWDREYIKRIGIRMDWKYVAENVVGVINEMMRTDNKEKI